MLDAEGPEVSVVGFVLTSFGGYRRDGSGQVATVRELRPSSFHYGDGLFPKATGTPRASGLEDRCVVTRHHTRVGRAGGNDIPASLRIP